jgi:hypothetical protein
VIRYAVHPGFVFSQHDDDYHYIGAGQLMDLYGVDPRECVTVRPDMNKLGRGYSDLIDLYPRYYGDYTL